MRSFVRVFLGSAALWTGVFSCARAEPAIVSQEKSTVEVGPFLSYDATVTNYGDGSGTVKFGKPQWMAPMMNAAVDYTLNRTVESAFECGVKAIFSDEYQGPVVSVFYIPPGKGDWFTTTDRDGRTMSAATRAKLKQRLLAR